ncbi:cysteine--tRNA ligase [Helicobacter anseris]|uniref:Cysteine--tRNA ligase n=1 Tax=Helicobacter anseris TaxID=375926 RepID=A0A3D8J4S0_9HELI|nr:cysteine--tRNA ligase [Helicobacter anseris]RDU71884.1 cysteine--tRNA ligase [Helicobacter anseris]
MKIYDSRLKEKVEFIPQSQKVRIYVCGPTVYDDAHLGHARSSIAFDLLKRVLLASGYEVILVKNFTDIDDKIINKSLQNNIPIQEITQRYIQSYLNDMQALNVLRPDIEPKATESLEAIANFIQILLDKGCAYKTTNGDIYLEVSKDQSYGSISQRGIDDINQSRILENEEKKDSRDFALWKAYKGENDIGYESILGRGRPGWHIECSAMIEKHLSYENQEFCIDIHAGGADLLFPHHENEASQTRCAHNKELAKYWMHNGFVNVNGEKMSKSLGNSFFIKDALKIYDGEILRNYLIATHYRAILNFSEEDLLQSKKRLDKIYRLKKRIQGALDSHQDSAFQKNFLEALQDDLNISKALSILEEMLNTANQSLDKNPKDKNLQSQIQSDLNFLEKILGIGLKNPIEYFQLGISKEQKCQIEEKLQIRQQAKKEKNFELADSIREELKSQGILIMDTPNGSIWEKIT